MKRMCDLVISLLLMILLLLPFTLIAIAIRVSSIGPILYWSERVGKENQRFYMPKFRTMRIGTPAVANPSSR